MEEIYQYVVLLNGKKRPVSWEEFNQLKKDILWIYDEHYGRIKYAFIPEETFKLKYWQYLTLDSDDEFDEKEKEFYSEGVLVIILCLCIEYIDVTGCSNKLLKRKEIPTIIKYVKNFKPKTKQQELIKNKVLLGLSMAQSITEEDLLNPNYYHEGEYQFLSDVDNIANSIIRKYYKSKLEKNDNK